MYAVIETGGKQYKVTPDKKQLIQVEKIEATVGESINFPALLFKPEQGELQVGSPLLPHITVTATVVDQIRGEKIRIIKYRRRKHHKKQMGHRQYHTLLEITNIRG